MAIEVAVNVVYFFVLRCSMGFGILIFWALGICMVTCLARDSLFTRPSPHETVERELRDGYGSAYSA